MIHASLFSGIGGAELAASWMGWDNIFHCEINPFGRKVLDYWFPKSKSYEDITKTDFKEWRGKVDVLTGGFPCQPFSQAGKRKGDTDDRYLWPQMLRAIREIRPTWVVGENVAGITSMVESGEDVEVGRVTDIFEESVIYRKKQKFTIERICEDFESIGYAVQPILIPACAVGAPHRRDRVWFIARRGEGSITNATGHGGYRIPASSSEETGRSNGEKAEQFAKRRKIRATTDTDSEGSKGKLLGQPTKSQSDRQNSGIVQTNWHNFPTQSPICCGNDGISDRLDGITFPKWRSESLKAYGNAWVPQVAYEIFKAISNTTQ